MARPSYISNGYRSRDTLFGVANGSHVCLKVDCRGEGIDHSEGWLACRRVNYVESQGQKVGHVP
ncbi:MAG: hypothetical protein NTU41_03905 [Chloroflexi bacterium]|nr:hypothetical protein [Chloroflexota bacterium]